MAINTRIWMTGSLDWFGYIGDQEMFLGHRSFPNPPEEGDAWTNDEQYRNKRGVSAVTKASILYGQIEHLTGGYKAAMKRRPDWQKALAQAFRQVDMIALPTLKTLPPRIPRFGGSVIFEAYNFSLQNTVGFNFSGNPAIAIPIPMEGELVKTTSLQLVGPRMSEAQLLNAGRIVSSKLK